MPRQPPPLWNTPLPFHRRGQEKESSLHTKITTAGTSAKQNKTTERKDISNVPDAHGGVLGPVVMTMYLTNIAFMSACETHFTAGKQIKVRWTEEVGYG